MIYIVIVSQFPDLYLSRMKYFGHIKRKLAE